VALQQSIREELLFAFKILFQGFVIIKMLGGKIREDHSVKLTPKHTVKIEPVGRNFHDHMRGPSLQHLPQDSLKI
jgi:hypothetical protein